jgi:hypothetical protein
MARVATGNLLLGNGSPSPSSRGGKIHVPVSVKLAVENWPPSLSRTGNNNLLISNPQGETAGGQRGHIASHSRPSVRARGRSRSGESRSFCKKSPRYLTKSTSSPASSLRRFLRKKTQSNLQSNLHGSRRFAKKPLSFQ